MSRPLSVTKSFRFQGDSMLPLLEDGDEIWVRSLPKSAMRRGQLVVYARFDGGEPSLIVHRLLEDGKTGGRLRLRGDACLEEDGPVESADILGRVVGLRRGGSLVLFDSASGRFWDRFCLRCARAAAAWARCRLLPAVERRAGAGAARFLRGALMLAPRTLFSALFAAGPAPVPDRTPGKLKAAALLIVFGAAVLAYASSLGNGFVWDDHIYVSGNPFLKDPSNLLLLFSPRFYTQVQGIHLQSRPVLLGSLLLDRLLFGPGPFGHHLSSLLLHACNSVWVLVLGLMLFPGWGRKTEDSFPWAAAAAGLLFACHPALSEAVLGVSFRADLLAAFFSFASLWGFLKWRRGGGIGWLALAGAGFLLGLLSKEMAAVVPLLAVLCELYFFRDGHALRRSGAALAAYALAALLFAGFWAPRFRYRGVGVERFDRMAAEDLAEGAAERPLFSPPEPRYAFEPSPPPWKAMYGDAGLRARTMAVVLGGYLKQLFVPSELVVDRAPVLIAGWKDRRFLAGVLSLLALAGLALLLRGCCPPAAFGAAWILAAMLPVSGLVPLYNPAAERYLYLLCPGAAWLLASALWEGGAAFGPRRTSASSAALALVAGLFGMKAFLRGFDWKSDAALFESVPEGASVSPRVYYNRARTRWEKGLVKGAFEDYRRAVRMDPLYAEAWLNLGTLLRSLGKKADAERCYERAVAAAAADPMPAFVYGKWLETRGERGKAKKLFLRALEIHPGFAPARARLEALGAP